MSDASLVKTLRNLHAQVTARQQERRELRIKQGKMEREMTHELGLGHVVISEDVRAFFEGVKNSVMYDAGRYVPKAGGKPSVEVAEGNAATEIAPEPVVALPPHLMVARAQALQQGTKQAAAAPATAPVSLAAAVQSVHLRPLFEAWQRVEHLLPVAGGEHLPPEMRACYVFMSHEIAMLTDEQAHRNAMVAPALLTKMRQAMTALSEGRSNDTVTLLKNALNGDPHNHTLLAMLSQVLYLAASTGKQTVLPEAREHAQRSTIYSEKIPPNKLALYRYLAMVTELGFGHERCMQWLRETGFLDPQALGTPEGLVAHKGLHLRAWAMLAQMPISLWEESEYQALKTIVTHTVGGAAMYLIWFRPALLQAQANSKTPLPLVEEIERFVNTSYIAFNDVAKNMQALPLATSALPWFLRVRFLNTMAQIAPLPTFDQALCMVALDGQGYREDVFPDKELRHVLEDSSLAYWRLWCMVMTPYKDVRQPYLLPAEETVQDGPLLTMCDQFLNELHQAEQRRIKPQLWDDLQPWLNNWRVEHLLAAGVGTNKPRGHFMPNLVPYTHFYRKWQEPAPVATLPSVVIRQTAERGAFSGIFEILAAFEGAIRLLDDPAYGLVQGQKRALSEAKKQNPKKFAGFADDFGKVSGQGVMMVILPFAMLGGMAAIVQMSANWSQAAGLMLALAGVAGVVMVNLTKK